MMNITIQKAGLSDMNLLLQWRMEVLREVFSIPQGCPVDGLLEENRRYYEKALASEEHIACFVCVDGETAGCGGLCLYQEMPSPDNPTGACAYLMNIYTRPPYRKQGVGEAVVNWLTAQARRRGISKIYLETSSAGRSLYQKMGYVPMQDMMKLPDTAGQ